MEPRAHGAFRPCGRRPAGNNAVGQPGGLSAGRLAPGAGHVPVALCGHDHLCAALAAAHSRPGSICNSMGTAETFVGTRAARPLQAVDFEAGLTWGPFVRPGRQYWMANIPSAGLCMEWVRCALPGHEISYEEVERALEKSAGPAQAMFFPWLSGTGTPTYRADLGGVFWGLDTGMRLGRNGERCGRGPFPVGEMRPCLRAAGGAGAGVCCRRCMPFCRMDAAQGRCAAQGCVLFRYTGGHIARRCGTDVRSVRPSLCTA